MKYRSSYIVPRPTPNHGSAKLVHIQVVISASPKPNRVLTEVVAELMAVSSPVMSHFVYFLLKADPV